MDTVVANEHPPASMTAGRWAGVPPDERRAQRRAMLVRAAFELLVEQGSAGTSVRAVCRWTGLNPRYFYESFESLDELIVAVYDEVVGELATVVRSAVDAAPAGASAQIRAAVDSTVCFIDEDRRRGRILYVEALGNEALNRRRIETGHRLVELIERDSASRRAGVGAGDPIGMMRAAILVGGFTELLVSWLDGRLEVTRDQLVEDSTALFLALRDAADTIAASRA